MANIELIKQLRLLTNAPMKECKDALDASADDLEKAVDIIKVKGLNISNERLAKVATEGLVTIKTSTEGKIAVMVETNCNTNFVAKSEEFIAFSDHVTSAFAGKMLLGKEFNVEVFEDERRAFIAKTRENIVIRRWWAEQAEDPTVKVFNYLHSNNKLGVLLTMQAPSVEAANSPEFKELGNNLAMQICAMNPIAIDPERISAADIARQKEIFAEQVRQSNNPKQIAIMDKIIDGKVKKFYKEVCLIDQESILSPKLSIQQIINSTEDKLGGTIQIINFVRAEVGEGLIKNQENLAEEVAKLI
jgi:elongation factor Ts